MWTNTAVFILRIIIDWNHIMVQMNFKLNLTIATSKKKPQRHPGLRVRCIQHKKPAPMMSSRKWPGQSHLGRISSVCNFAQQWPTAHQSGPIHFSINGLTRCPHPILELPKLLIGPSIVSLDCSGGHFPSGTIEDSHSPRMSKMGLIENRVPQFQWIIRTITIKMAILWVFPHFRTHPDGATMFQ